MIARFIRSGAWWRVAIVAVLVALALRYGSVSNVTDYLSVRLLWAMLAAQPLLFASVVMITLRFALLASTQPVPFVPTFKAMLLSIGLNAVLPARVSELLKATYLRDHADVSTTAGLAALFLERLIDVVILGLLALASMGLLLVDASGTVVALMLIALGTFAMLPRLEQPLIDLARRIPWYASRNIAERFLSHLSGRMRDRLFYRAFLYGLMAWALSCASVVVVLYFAGSIPLGVVGYLTVFVATTVGGAVPALPGGFGTYEAAAVLALKGFGYGFDEALALALALHISQLAGTLVTALAIAVTERIGIATLFRQALDAVQAKVR